MAVYLPLIADALLNNPLCLHEKKAMVISAVLRNKLNIASYERMALGGGRLERGDLADVEALARRNAIAGISNLPPPQKTTDGWYGDRPYEMSTSGIALIQVWGTLCRTWGVGPDSGFTGYDGIMTQIDFAQSDPMCRGIFAHINSGGGTVDGLFECSDFIAQCSARNGGKPIFAYAGDYAYSAAYALAAACDQVFMGETGGVGSIGCITLYADLSRALEEEGIDITVFRSAPGKALGVGGVETLPDAEIERIQAQIDYLGNVFVKRVATYMPALTQTAVAQTLGLDYMAPDAKAIGLVNDRSVHAGGVGETRATCRSLTKGLVSMSHRLLTAAAARLSTAASAAAIAAGATIPPAAPAAAAPGATAEDPVDVVTLADAQAAVTTALAEGATAERTRTAAVMSSEAGKGNPEMAAFMLNTNPGATADQIVAHLGTMPKAAATSGAAAPAAAGAAAPAAPATPAAPAAAAPLTHALNQTPVVTVGATAPTGEEQSQGDIDKFWDGHITSAGAMGSKISAPISPPVCRGPATNLGQPSRHPQGSRGK